MANRNLDASNAGSNDRKEKVVSEKIPAWLQPGTFVAHDPSFLGILNLDAEGKVKSWDAELGRSLGYPSRELLGIEFTSLFTGSETERSEIEGFLFTNGTHEHNEFEAWLTMKGGAEVRVQLQVSKVVDAIESSVGASVVLREIALEGTFEEDPLDRIAQLRSLTSYLQISREAERTRFAKQLHDEFGQILTAIRLDLSVLGRMISESGSEQLGRVSVLEKISSISEILEKTIRSARDMITELRPPVLDELGLLTAIQWQLFEFENRTGIKCHFGRIQQGFSFDPEVSTVTFRLLQEALENVKKHSSATEVLVNLNIVGPNLLLEVSDNGREADSALPKDRSSIGIIGMRERVMVLGGSLDIRSDGDKGTLLVMSIPYHSNRGS